MFELVKNEFLVLVRSWSEIGFRLESESTFTFQERILFNTEIVKFLNKINLNEKCLGKVSRGLSEW